jgi:hypothetical protein
MSTQVSKPVASETVVEYEIVPGRAPGKWDLATALLESTCQHPRPVTFGIRERRLNSERKIELVGRTLFVSVLLASVEREDGSGESFNFRGYVDHKGSSPEIKGSIHDVSGHFRTDRRTGCLKLRIS